MTMKKRFIKYIIASAILIAIVSSTDLVFAEVNLSYKRLWGATRYETSVAISNSGWSSSQYVILASSENYPDALCAAPLAKKLNAPILLTGKDNLNDSSEEEIKKIGTKEIFIIGGVGAISQNIENNLISSGIKVTRLAGQDRYETSIKVAEALNSQNTKVTLASGGGFADALSISSIAAYQDMPILLTEKDVLPEKIAQYIKNKNISFSYVVGGSGVISENVINSLTTNKVANKRLWGQDRFETNIAVLNEFKSIMKLNKLYISSGEDFADALSGSALISRSLSPIVLVNKINNSSALNFINSSIDKTSEVIVLGGIGAVSNNTLRDVLTQIGIYTLIDEKEYQIDEVITLKNEGQSTVSNFIGILNLGTINNSPYQKGETLNIYGSGIKLTQNSEGKYDAIIEIPYIYSGQTITFNAVRSFTNGGIKYNVNLENTSGDYSDFEEYIKYTSSESKIESNNFLIIDKAQKIVNGEKNPYLKAKKIYEFVNTYLTYDYTEGNKGAFNALVTSKGICEDYADLFAAMARAVGIPSRVVFGYLEEPKNITAENQDISYARHAWVEFFLPEYGWVVSEPTVEYIVNGKKIAPMEYFANLDEGGHFLQTYSADDGFRSSYEGFSPRLNIDDTPYIKFLPK